MSISYLLAFCTIAAGMWLSIRKEKLTIPAALTGGLLASVIFIGAGYTGLFLLATFFILGVAATSWKLSMKMNSGLAEDKQGKRNAGQVFANAGAAAILALLAKFQAETVNIFPLMIAGCFSAATADTLSSELGNVYGKRYYHLLSFQKMQRGSNGAISLQGTVAGMLGSTIIAWVYMGGNNWNIRHFFMIIVAGTVGSIADSFLGLTLEKKGLLGNNSVNFLNTATGAIVIWLWTQLQVT